MGKKNSTPKEALYYGLAYQPGTGKLFASRGFQDKVTVHPVSASGAVGEGTQDIKGEQRSFSAGIAFKSNGNKLLFVNNQTTNAT